MFDCVLLFRTRRGPALSRRTAIRRGATGSGNDADYAERRSHAAFKIGGAAPSENLARRFARVAKRQNERREAIDAGLGKIAGMLPGVDFPSRKLVLVPYRYLMPSASSAVRKREISASFSPLSLP